MFLSFSKKNLKLCNKYFVELFFEILILSSAMNAESVRSIALTIFHLQSYFSRV